MKQKTYLILFLISFIFNLAFIGNYIYHRYFLYPHFHHYYTSQNKIFTEKFAHLQNIRRTIMHQRRKYLKERHEFMQMLQQPHITEKELREKLDLTIKNEMEMERKIGEDLIKLRKQMSDKEARVFFKNYYRRFQRRNRRNRP